MKPNIVDQTPPTAPHTPPEAARKPPHEWAIAKGLLKLNPDGSIHYKTHTPWQYHAARVMQKWADPTIDPSFAISEAEFDAAIAAIP